MTPHAASFVDPLYSTGIEQSLVFVLRLCDAVISDGKLEIQHEKLRQMDENFRIELAHADTLVAISYACWSVARRYEYAFVLWRQCVGEDYGKVSSDDLKFLNTPFLLGADVKGYPEALQNFLRLLKSNTSDALLREAFDSIINGFPRFAKRLQTGVFRHNDILVSAGRFDMYYGEPYFKSLQGVCPGDKGIPLIKALMNSWYLDLAKDRQHDDVSAPSLRKRFNPGEFGMEPCSEIE